MGLWDKVKGAVNAVTGGAAKVYIEVLGQPVRGEEVNVRVTVSSTGSEIRSQGIFVDLTAKEEIYIPNYKTAGEYSEGLHTSTFDQAFQIAAPLTLMPNETRTFEGTIAVPSNAPPTYQGPYCKHNWRIRGRVEMFGNDPDSGYIDIFVY